MDNETVVRTTSAPPPLPGVVPGKPRLTRLIVPLAVAILVSLVWAQAVLLLRAGGDGERGEVVQTSQRFLVLLTTYNADTLPSQRAEVLRLAVGRFRTEYTTVTGPDLQNALRERQADSKGTVERIAIVSLEGDQAEVLAVVKVSTKNKDLPNPRVEANLIELSLVRTGSGWRIDAVTIVGIVVQQP